MAKIVTLKNNNDEEVYPITTAGAVNGGLYADNGIEVSGVVPDVTTNRIVDGAVTAAKIDLSKLFFYKACSQVSPINISTAWTNTPISGWSLTFSAEVDATYRVEIVSGYVAYTGSAPAEVDLKMNWTGLAQVGTYAPSTMTGTYGGGVSIGRIAVGIFRATSASATITACISSGATGSLFRVDAGYIFVMRIA